MKKDANRSQDQVPLLRKWNGSNYTEDAWPYSTLGEATHVSDKLNGGTSLVDMGLYQQLVSVGQGAETWAAISYDTGRAYAIRYNDKHGNWHDWYPAQPPKRQS